MKKFFKYLLKYKLLIIVVYILLIIQTMTNLLLPTFMSELLNEGVRISTNNGNTSFIFPIVAKMIAVTLVSLAAAVSVYFTVSFIATNVSRNMRDDLFAKVLSFSNNELDKFSIASLITRSTNDIQQVQAFIISLTTILSAPITVIGGLYMIITKNASMVWIVALASASITIILAILFSFALKIFSLSQKIMDKINMVSREALTGVLVIRAFINEHFQEERLDEQNIDLREKLTFVSKLMGLLSPSISFIMNTTTLLIVWYGAKQIDMNLLNPGDILAFIQYSMQIIISFIMLAFVFTMLPRTLIALRRVNEVLDTELSIKEPINPIHTKDENKGELEFKSVSFKYPNAEEDTLHDISFKINKGETVSFIGSTGSGKSTIINLINRFYDVTNGEILLNGVNIKDIKSKELREHIAIVQQKAFLFSGTIESNIKYYDDNISDEIMKNASNISQSYEFINNIENGYNYQISESATNLSGGQKQRLSIARALAKDSDFIIFDDSFSALDYKTEQKLRSSLLASHKDTTLLIISQRISTIKNSDKIIVLDNGNLVGMGTHIELLNNCSIYKEIAYSQLTEDEINEGVHNEKQ